MGAEDYVCAFRGRRDSYQVPLALAQEGMLDQFITDAYDEPWLRTLSAIGPASIREKLESRKQAGIPDDRVRCLWGTTLVEHARHRLGFAPMLTYNKLDRHFSWAAAKRAAQTGSNLLLYSPYAWEAFTASYPRTPRKVLFQYHPHPALERRITAADSARFPDAGESYTGTLYGQVPEELALRDRDVWKQADLVICASSFTRRSLLEAGAAEELCRIVPYGIDVSAGDVDSPPASQFRALFVGSGGQRKGLHHLLMAWRRAALPPSSRLTLVCRVMDRGIERAVAETPGVKVVRGANAAELATLYESSSLFVMPSLVEGFGQVYLEALARGCPVLGTANTCLPDLGGEADGIFLVEAGNVDALTARLEQLAGTVAGDRQLRSAARACAGKFSWTAFRDGIIRALANPAAY